MLRNIYEAVMPVIIMLVVMATLVAIGCAIFDEHAPLFGRSGALVVVIIGTRGLHKMMEGAATGKTT